MHVRAAPATTTVQRTDIATVEDNAVTLLNTIIDCSSNTTKGAPDKHLNWALRVHTDTQKALAKKKIPLESMSLVANLLSFVERLCKKPEDLEAQQGLSDSIEALKSKRNLYALLAGALIAFLGAVILVASVAAIAMSFGMLTPPALIGVVVGTCAAAKGFSILCAAIGACVLAKGLSMCLQNIRHSVPTYLKSGVTFFKKICPNYRKPSVDKTSAKQSDTGDVLIPAFITPRRTLKHA